MCHRPLLGIFTLWVLFKVFGWDPKTGEFHATGYVADLVGGAGHEPSTVARLSLLVVGVVFTFTLVLVAAAAPRWKAKLDAARTQSKGD